jgi:hypothetical protein
MVSLLLEEINKAIDSINSLVPKVFMLMIINDVFILLIVGIIVLLNGNRMQGQVKW